MLQQVIHCIFFCRIKKKLKRQFSDPVLWSLKCQKIMHFSVDCSQNSISDTCNLPKLSYLLNRRQRHSKMNSVDVVK